jgi:hypothetical protein
LTPPNLRWVDTIVAFEFDGVVDELLIVASDETFIVSGVIVIGALVDVDTRRVLASGT